MGCPLKSAAITLELSIAELLALKKTHLEDSSGSAWDVLGEVAPPQLLLLHGQLLRNLHLQLQPNNMA